MKNKYFVGLDIGSTTVKTAVFSEGQLIFKKYQRHFTKQAEVTLNLLLEIEQFLPEDAEIYIGTTGSGASTLAPKINGKFYQEVNCVSHAVNDKFPDVMSVVELGGQDAKVIIYKQSEDGSTKTLSFMNDKCASGTGATIDKCLIKIGVNEDQMSKVTFDPEKLHNVAAKCGVFAETDIVNLIKSGVDSFEILNSLADSIVNQNLSVLTKGYILRPKVLLLGGPNNFLPFLVDCFRLRIAEIWKKREVSFDPEKINELIFVPEDSIYFAATGAALFLSGEDKVVIEKHLFNSIDQLRFFIEKGRMELLKTISGPPLALDQNELAGFIESYTLTDFVPPPVSGHKVSAYLGIDGGSTSTKCVLIDKDERLILKEYVLSKGNPLIDLQEIVKNIRNYYLTQNQELEILGVGVTGYAANFLDKILSADINIIETIAHMKSSQKFFGSIDVICDVGGQDIKVLFFRNDELANFKLSNQCSAGNGMMLQALAEQFGLPITQFAENAFKAEIAPVFSYGCAVFLDSDRVNFQKQGFSKEEIMSGMAQVLPKNIWQYIVQIPRLEQFGKKYVLQGGTQRNLAALKAQVDYIKERVSGAEVFLHPHPGEAGAIGAAIEAKEIVELRGQSNFIGMETLIDLLFKTKSDESTRCHFCPNLCSRTFIDVKIKSENVRYISGFSCEKGTVESSAELQILLDNKKERLGLTSNLVREEARLLFSKNADFLNVPVVARKKQAFKIGLPKVLNMWTMGPFFNAFLLSLGFEKDQIIWSQETNDQMSKAGMKYGAIDPCYPAKVAQAHVHQLIFDRSVDIIYFPAITHMPNYLVKTTGSTSCPVVQGTPLVMRSSFTIEGNLFGHRHYLNAAHDFGDIAYLKKQLHEMWNPLINVSKDDISQAVDIGMRALDNYDLALQEKGRKAIELAELNQTFVILLLARPYHLDHGLNHQILDEIQSLGFPVITMRSIPKDIEFLNKYFYKDLEEKRIMSPLEINDVWKECFSTNSAQKVWAAKFAARNSNVAVIDISSFKCGHDAPTYGIIDSIIGAAKTSYLSLHDLDQTSPTESFKIRLKTFAYNLNKKTLQKKSKNQIGESCMPNQTQSLHQTLNGEKTISQNSL